MSFLKKLAEMNGAVLYKAAAQPFQIEVRDEGLTPTVYVTGSGKSSFSLDKLGIMYGDADGKLYDELTGEIVPPSEFHDMAIQAHLSATAECESCEVGCSGDARCNCNCHPPGEDE